MPSDRAYGIRDYDHTSGILGGRDLGSERARRPDNPLGYDEGAYRELGGALRGGNYVSQGNEALARAVEAQRGTTAGLAATMESPTAAKAASQALANVSNTALHAGNALQAQDQQARQSLLSGIAMQGLQTGMGWEDAERQRRMAQYGIQAQRDVANMGLYSNLVGGLTTGSIGALQRSDERAKAPAAEDAPVAARPSDALGVVLAMVGRLNAKIDAIEGRGR